MFCIHCGKEIEDGSKFCGYCGKPLEEKTEESPAAPVEKKTVETAPVSAETKETAEPVEEKTVETAPVSAEIKETAEPVEEKTVETAPISAEIKETAEPVEEKTVETAPVNTEIKETAEPVEEMPSTVLESAVEEAKENVEKAVEAVNETVESAAEALREVAEAPAEAVVKPKEKAESLSAPEELPVEDEGGTKTLDIKALGKSKSLVIIVAALAAPVLLVVIAVVLSVSASSGGTGIIGDYYGEIVDGEYVMYYNGTKIETLNRSGDLEQGKSSADGTKLVARSDKSLYYLADGKITEITDEKVSAYSISSDGSTVVYVFDDDIYTFKNDKSAKVGTVDDKLFNNPVISPNGDTIVYAEADDNGRYSTYAIKNGKVIDLDARIYPLSVSNGGEVIYGFGKNGKLCYIKGLKPDSAESIKELDGYTDTNSDNKQIIFRSANGYYYFDTTLEDPIKITSSNITLIYPAGSLETYSDFKSFYAITTDYKIYKYTRKGKDDFEAERLATISHYNYKLSSDGRTLVYMNNDEELCKISVANPDKEEVLAENIEGFVADDSLNHIYFGNTDSDIRYYDGKSKNGKKILSEADTTVAAGFTPNGVLVYADEDGDLYYSDRGGDKKKAGVDDVENITVAKDGTVYVKADGDIYVSEDGKRFAKP